MQMHLIMVRELVHSVNCSISYKIMQIVQEATNLEFADCTGIYKSGVLQHPFSMGVCFLFFFSLFLGFWVGMSFLVGSFCFRFVVGMGVLVVVDIKLFTSKIQ